MKSKPSDLGDKPENRPLLDRFGEIASEEDYSRVSSHLADELMRENTAEEMALALAHYLIYVNELSAVILEQQRQMQALGEGRARRDDLIVKESVQATTQALTKVSTLAAIAIRRNLPKALASNAAKTKHASSTKAGEKNIMRECWNAWRANPGRYRGKADFARDMLDKFPDWKNAKVIEGFCRKWEKEKPDE